MTPAIAKMPARSQLFDLGRQHPWRTFTPARAYVRGDYPRLPVLPKDIPTNPDRIYTKSGWKGYGD